MRGAGLAEPVSTGLAMAGCVAARLPHHLLAATGIRGWALSLTVVVAFVNGARALVRAPFTLARALSAGRDPRTAARRWAGGEAKALVATAAFGAVLSLPLYALLRTTSAWWLFAWMLFAALTVVGQLATPLTLRAECGPLRPAPGPLADRVRALGYRAGVDIGGTAASVVLAGKEGRSCRNAYVVGLGPTRRVVLEEALAAWPAPLVDQVVAHEIGHWRLGHAARRLPLTIATQLATFALAAWVLSLPPLLHSAGLAAPGDPRSYPLLLLLTPLLALPARCVLAWRDRAQERAADAFALSLLRAPLHFTAMLDRAADEGGAPRRLPWWRRLTASHPPIEERALACTRFASTG
jgi:STE24 endopeptidase